MNKRFALQKNDGKSCAQVLVYNQDDVKYWIDQCIKTNHMIALDFHVDENALGYLDPAHDVYQIFPQEQARHFTGRGLTPLALDGAKAPDFQHSFPADVLDGDGILPEPPPLTQTVGQKEKT